MEGWEGSAFLARLDNDDFLVVSKGRTTVASNSSLVKADDRGRIPLMTNFPLLSPEVHFMGLAWVKMFPTLWMNFAAGRWGSSHWAW